MVNINEGIAIGELVVFIPLLITSLIVCWRHEFQKQLGWIYLALFCGISGAGAVFTILAENDPNNVTYQVWSASLSGVGLSPMTMAALGLLKRVYVAPRSYAKERSSLTDFQI